MSALVARRVPGSRRPPLIAGVVLSAAGLGMIALLRGSLAGWVFLLPGGLLLVTGMQAPGAPVEAIVIDDAGLSYHGMKVGPIPWDAIIRADVARVKHIPVVALQLTQPDAWLDRMPESHRKLVALGTAELGLPPVFLYAAGLDHSAEEIVAAINQRARGKP